MVWVGGAAATYDWVSRESRDDNIAAVTGTQPPLLNNAILVAMVLIGITYLIVVHTLAKAQLIEFGLILLVLGLLVAGGTVALRNPEPATRQAGGRLVVRPHYTENHSRLITLLSQCDSS